MGPTGVGGVGTTGPVGATGTQGPQGVTGPAGGGAGGSGSMGPTGQVGPTGAEGVGTTGPQGATGSAGPQGVTGPAGSGSTVVPAGVSGSIQYNSGNTSLAGSSNFTYNDSVYALNLAQSSSNYQIAGTSVLNSTTLGTGVVNSFLQNINPSTNILFIGNRTTNKYFEFGADTTLIDFISSGITGTDYNARIRCTGGSTTTGSGTLTYGAQSHVFNNTINLNPTVSAAPLIITNSTLASGSSQEIVFGRGGTGATNDSASLKYTYNTAGGSNKVGLGIYRSSNILTVAQTGETIISTSSANGLQVYNSALTSGGTPQSLNWGRAGTTNQAVQLDFNYNTTAASNRLGLGFWGNANLMTLNQTGDVVIERNLTTNNGNITCLEDATTGAFTHSINQSKDATQSFTGINSGMVDTQRVILTLGKALSLNNSIELYHRYNGTTSSLNQLAMGFYGNGDLLALNQDGETFFNKNKIYPLNGAVFTNAAASAGSTGQLNYDGAIYRYPSAGQLYISVDDNFYIRKSPNTTGAFDNTENIIFHFDVANTRLGIGVKDPTANLVLPNNGSINTNGGTLYSQSIYASTSSNGSNMTILSQGQIQRSTSSGKYKTQVEDADPNYSKNIYSMRPVWFRSLCEGDNPNHSHWGLIAEEMAELDPRLCFFGENNEPEGVQYDRIIPLMLVEMKLLRARIQELETKIASFT